MTTLRDGTIVDESINAANFTDDLDVPAVFKQGPRREESITIHHWGDPGQDFDAVVRYLASPNPRFSSAHAVIMAGRATAIVSPDEAAWHAGNAYGQATSIGLELRPEATDGDYITAAAYIAFLRGIYGDLPLIPHNHWKATACPGKWDLARLDALARNGAPAAPVAPAAVPANAPVPIQRPDSEIHWVVDPGDTLGKIAAHYGIPKDVQRIADYNGIGHVNTIHAGQKIFIPGPLVWIIEAPDTIRSIAAYYGLDAGYLASLNGLPGPDAEIYIGNVLTIKA